MRPGTKRAAMDTTVVIATRDRRGAILRTLEHLEALPERPPIVVVDNESSDGTPDAVRRRHPAVQVIEAGRNLGCGARTLGARHARTPYVALCDDDSWWASGSLERAAALLDSNPELALVAARIIVEPDGRIDPTCRLMAESPLPHDPQLPGPPEVGVPGERRIRAALWSRRRGDAFVDRPRRSRLAFDLRRQRGRAPRAVAG